MNGRDGERAGPGPGEGLLDGIARDADAEAGRLITEARAAAAERRRAVGEQAERILREADATAAERVGAIRKHVGAALRMEKRRISLRVREQVVELVLDGVRERVARMVGSPGYREILIGWIVEGVIGLGAAEAGVNVSAPELAIVDGTLRREAEGRVMELAGRSVSLRGPEGDPLIGQGVVLRAGDGRVEFNNQVSTRLLRYQSEIRKIIYGELFE